MGRCGWGVGIALILAVFSASCGGTGGGPSDSGSQFVFTARGRLGLAVQTVSANAQQTANAQSTLDPKKLLLTATLLDPQGVPFRNELVTFTADFPDATFIPGNDNTGSVRTDDNGQASITLVAGLTLGKMRVVVEAPSALNISTGITVTLTEQGFIGLGDLVVIPSSVTFVNPAPHPPGGPADFIFQAAGGDPPYRFFNSNPSVGEIKTAGVVGSLGQYSLTGPLPTDEDEARVDTVILQDAGGARAEATVQVLFVTCNLSVSPDEDIPFNDAIGGESARITVPDAVPPIFVTQTLPAAGTVLVDNDAKTITFTVATPPVQGTNTLLIRDSRGCTTSARVTVAVSLPVITPISVTLSPGQRQQFIVTGGVPPYRVATNGGTVNTTVVTQAGGSFVYTAGAAEGTFSIVVTDALNAVVQATVTIDVATLEVEPEELLFCNTGGGETARISIITGVPPFTATHTFDAAGSLTCEATNATGDTISCSGNSIIYTVQVASPSFFDPDSVVIRDSQGRTATVSVSINTEDCPDLCGNGIADLGEQCDTSDLVGQTCTSLGFAGGGTLACTDDCTFDTSGCTNSQCGNGEINAGEQCDGLDLDGTTCTSLGFVGGGLTCSSDCTFNTGGCTN